MKKKLLVSILLLSFSSLTFCGCGEKNVSINEPASSVSKIEVSIGSDENAPAGQEGNTELSTESSKELDATSVSPDNKDESTSVSETDSTSTSSVEKKDDTKVEEIDYEKIYNKILDRVFELLSEDDYWDKVVEGETGIVEARAYLDDYLSNIGYVYEDLNGDKLPELLITGLLDDKDCILAAYTISNGSAELILEGYARSAYFYAGNGLFIYRGSSGASYSAFGNYKISDEGKTLQCIDFYYSDIDDNYNPLYFHNNTGEWENSKSEKIDIDTEAFFEMEKQYTDMAIKLETTPMAVYASEMKSEKANSQVIVAWAKDVLSDASVFEDIIIDKDEYAVKIAFSTKSSVKNFKILKLTMVETEDGDNVTFEGEPVYSQDLLNKEKLVAAKLSLPGDLPSYGFSYEDSEGKERKFAIAESGKDGSLELYEFGNEEEEKEEKN